MIFFKLVKPAMSALLTPAAAPVPAPGSQLSEVVSDAAAPPPKPKLPLRVLQAPDDSDRLDAARGLAKSNPAAVAHIVRGWVNGAEANNT